MAANKPQDPNLTAPRADSAADIAANVDAVMRKFDRESNTRIWTGIPKIIVSSLLVLFSIYCIYTTLFSTMMEQVRLTSFMGLMVIMGFLTFPVKKGYTKPNHLPWYDLVIMAAGAAAFFFFAFNAKEMMTMRLKNYLANPLYTIVGITGILVLMELCRRSVGVPILCVAGAFLAYTFISGETLELTVKLLFYSDAGILGTPVSVCSKYIVVFIIFGAFLEHTGVANFFISLANSLTGRFAGGPAKVAVISSALCGMVSGSSVGNTVTTGSITIPMMKNTGYKPEFAGAVEAAASTGGQIMPPIMGAAAFLMAEYLGRPYSDIIVRAIVPAVLYFLGIFIAVHLEAKKLGLKGIAPELLPRMGSLVKDTYMLLPLIILIYLVCSNAHTMQFSAAVAIIVSMAVGFINNFTRIRPRLTQAAILTAILIVYAVVPNLPVYQSTPFLQKSWDVIAICCIAAIILFGFIVNLVQRKKAAATGSEVSSGNAEVFNEKTLFSALESGGRSCISVAVACGMAGIITGCLTVTGLASKMITAIVSLTKAPLLAAIPGLPLLVGLLLTMLCCIILGMGIPTTATYCIMASTCAPILTQMGVPMLAAHFFVFYFGIVADITPPVALAAYAGAAIAKGNPMKTGVTATRLAIGAFIIPFVFCASPALLFIDTVWYEVVLNIITATIGMMGVAAGLSGYLLTRMNLLERILLIGGGLALIIPGTLTDFIGLGLIALGVGLQLIRKRAAKPNT